MLWVVGCDVVVDNDNEQRYVLYAWLEHVASVSFAKKHSVVDR